MKISSSAGKTEKDDARVTVSTYIGTGPNYSINSPVRSLFASAQDRIVTETLDDMNAGDLHIDIEDNQALDYVLVARIKTAVHRYRSHGAGL